jgi:hypothetical protein
MQAMSGDLDDPATFKPRSVWENCRTQHRKGVAPVGFYWKCVKLRIDRLENLSIIIPEYEAQVLHTHLACILE